MLNGNFGMCIFDNIQKNALQNEKQSQQPAQNQGCLSTASGHPQHLSRWAAEPDPVHQQRDRIFWANIEKRGGTRQKELKFGQQNHIEN